MQRLFFDAAGTPQRIRQSAFLLCVCAALLISCARQPPPFEFREGDLIFQSLPRTSELVDAIEGATQSAWSHCGVIMREDNQWVVYEAIGNVHHTLLPDWIRRGRGERFEVYRLKPGIAFDTENLRAQLKSFWGKPYDFHYAPDDSAIYCSELVYKAYDRAADIQIGTWQTLGSLDWKRFENFILTIEPEVPLERLMITPVALTRSERVERVHARGGVGE
ncbi:MAG: hypothetical protein FWH21_02020 [Kiritimatiellaeota bacterium]|nr:hypothetical protein [Kiritimatiellota bacterium]